jgi:hypothetical protein
MPVDSSLDVRDQRLVAFPGDRSADRPLASSRRSGWLAARPGGLRPKPTVNGPCDRHELSRTGTLEIALRVEASDGRTLGRRQ